MPVTTASSEFYVWSFPGAPIQIHLSLEVVRRMGEHLNGAPRAGLLLGRIDTPGLPEITDFWPVSSTDPEELAAAVTEVKSSSDDLLALGYYRTHDEENLSLSANDLSLAEAFFSDPNFVFLLIRRSNSAPANAGFFFWDRGQINGGFHDFCFLEFPFEAQLLAGAEPPAERSAAVAPQPYPEPKADPQTPISPAPVEPRTRRSRGLSRIIAVILAAAAAFATGVLLSPKMIRVGGAEATSASPALLKVQRQGTDLAVSWDHKAPAVTSAETGRLTIYDVATREFLLDRVHLRSSSLVYAPMTSQVRVQLDLIAPDKKITSESVMFILNRQESTPAGDDQPRATEIMPLAAATTGINGLPARMIVSSESTVTASRDDAAAVPVHRVMPPRLTPAQRAFVSGPLAIDIKVSIDTGGRVRKAEPLTQASPVLVTSALNAARLWRFQPARKQGQNVPAETVLQFQFDPSK